MLWVGSKQPVRLSREIPTPQGEGAGRGWKGLEGERYVVLFLVLIISQQIKVEGVEPHGIQFAFLAFVTPPARMSSFEFLLVGAFPSIYR